MHRAQMSDRELALLRTCLGRAKRVLEFGAGGSTIIAAADGREVLSVDSDPEWIKELAGDRYLVGAVRAGNLKLLHVDIGPVGPRGRPVDRRSRDKWCEYHRVPWRHLDPQGLDLVIVNGRFRVACALQSALRVTGRCDIAVRDFWDRSQYAVIQDFFTLLAAVDSLAVFRVTEPRSVAGIVDALLDYQDDPT